jgi:hypothetical protein
MGRTVGAVSLNFTAGNGQLISVLEQNKAKLTEYKNHAISSTQAAGAAFRALDGTLSIRAVEQFTTKFLGLGPILQAAFPLVGALAFADVIHNMSDKAEEFFNKIRFGAEIAMAAFRNMNAPLRAANDELRITNDRLDNDIAKLEGKRQNTLKLALDEARKSADDLADALLKDLGNLEKLMKQENISRFRSFFTGEASTTADKEDLFGKTGSGGFYGRVAQITDDSSKQIAGTKDSTEQKRLKAKENATLESEYTNQIQKTSKALQEAEAKQRQNAEAVKYTTDSRGNLHRVQIEAYADEETRIELLKGALRSLNMERAQIGLRQDKQDKTGKKEGLEADKSNMLAYKPVSDKIKELEAQLQGLNVKMSAIGKPEAFQIMAKASAEATKELAKLNKELEAHSTVVTKADAAKITSVNLSIANAEAESQWKTKIDASWVATSNRIRAQELLTVAVGKGYEATKQATVEAKMLEELGEKAFDSRFLKDHSDELNARRATLGSEVDAGLGQQAATTIDQLRTQMEVEKALFDVESQGVLAVARLTEAYKERDVYQKTKNADLVRSMREQFEAGQDLAGAKSLQPLQEKLRLTQAIVDAQIHGAEAERKAANEVKYSQLSKDKGQDVADAQRELDEREHQQKTRGSALSTGGNFGDRLQQNAQMARELEKMKKDYGDTFDVEVRLREVENERLQILTEQTLKIGTASAGVKAFFIEMQTQAKQASQIMYEALNSALEKVSDNFAKLATGQKTSWGKAFQGIGEDMMKSTTKSVLQQGLGAAGKALGIDTSGLIKPDGTRSNPLYVKNVDGANSLGGSLAGASKLGGKGGVFGDGDQGGGIFSALGKDRGDDSDGSGGSGFLSMFGKIFGALLIPHAAGGPVSPGGAYLVGENGPELLFAGASSGSMVSNTQTRQMMGHGGAVHQYFVDARGGDQQAFEAKMARVLPKVHNSAAATGVQASVERSKRVPSGA